MSLPTPDLHVAAITTATALVVSAVAGAFSLSGLLIAKEQKVSEFRQTWIDALRSDIAAYIARLSIIKAHIEMADSLDKAKLLEDTRDDYFEFNQAAIRIKLRLNSTEVESKAILQSMNELERLMNADFADIRGASASIDGFLRKLENDAPPLLKKEWKRVKRGEPTYRLAKWSAGLILLAAGCAATYIFLRMLK